MQSINEIVSTTTITVGGQVSTARTASNAVPAE
jgi:hypothetical protein